MTANSRAMLVALFFVTLFFAACNGPVTPPALPGGTSTATATATSTTDGDPIIDHLENRQPIPFSGAIEGTIPPNMSSYRYDPAAALGAMFELVLKPDAVVNNCFSPNMDDYQFKTIAPIGVGTGCTAEPKEVNQKFEERIVKGGVDADISYLVGEVGTKAEYAFEFVVNTTSAVSYPQSEGCFDVVKVVQIRPSPRSCEISIATGASVTQITYRQYSEFDADVRYNAVVNIDGKAYGSNSYMQSLLVLTVDNQPISNLYQRNAEGFLVALDEAEQFATTEAIEELTPDQFLMVYGGYNPFLNAAIPEIANGIYEESPIIAQPLLPEMELPICAECAILDAGS